MGAPRLNNYPIYGIKQDKNMPRPRVRWKGNYKELFYFQESYSPLIRRNGLHTAHEAEDD